MSAKTKSGYEPLDGVDVWFGRIKPGATSVQDVEFSLPGRSTSSDEVLLVSFEEANGHAPGEVTEHLRILAAAHPVLEISCTLGGQVNLGNPKRPVADPGETMIVSCQVKNSGSIVAKDVTLSLWLGDLSVESIVLGQIPAGQTTTHKTNVPIPSGAQLDAAMQVVSGVKETSFQSEASWRTTIYAGTPKLCPTKITRREYEERKAKLAKARDVGALDAEEFKRLHAELVRCLN